MHCAWFWVTKFVTFVACTARRVDRQALFAQLKRFFVLRTFEVRKGEVIYGDDVEVLDAHCFFVLLRC